MANGEIHHQSTLEAPSFRTPTCRNSLSSLDNVFIPEEPHPFEIPPGRKTAGEEGLVACASLTCPPQMSAWRQSSRRCLSYGVGSTLGSRLSQRRRTSAKRSGGETVADILVIDDDDELRDTLRAILEAAGYTMHEARNGREGIACCQAYPIAMVLTDLLMT